MDYVLLYRRRYMALCVCTMYECQHKNLLCDVRSSLIDCLMIHQLKRMSMYMSITLSRLLLLPLFIITYWIKPVLLLLSPAFVIVEFRIHFIFLFERFIPHYIKGKYPFLSLLLL